MRLSVPFRWLAALTLLLSLTPSVFVSAQDAVEPDTDTAEAVAADESMAMDAEADAEIAPSDEEVSSLQSFIAQLRAGGTTMVFLLALSIVGLAYILERLVHLRRGVIVPPTLADEADRHWRAGNFDQAKAVAAKSKSTLGRMIVALVEHRNATTADLNTIAGDIAARDLRRHMMRAYPLAVVATLSPLLGLLGTIIGMIQAFSIVAVAGSMGDASMLADSISLALVTTGVGLGIAVPTLAAYHFFRARTNLFGILLEEDASQLVTDWFVVQRINPAAPADGSNGQPAASQPAPAAAH